MKRLMIVLAFMPVPALAQSYANEEASIASNFAVSEDTTIGAPPTDTSDEKWRGSCDFSHVNWDDSLLFPGLIGGSPHLHMYTGNSLSNGNSTFTSMRTTGNGSCTGKRVNRSGYWFPVFKTDETHYKVPDFSTLYYLGGDNRLPRGLTMIGGRKPGDPTYYQNPPGVTVGSLSYIGDGFVGYSCEVGGFSSKILANVDCAAGDRLVASIDMPTCWDGVNISSATGRTHVTYVRRNDGTGQPECPTSHPYRIPAVQQKFFYSHNGPTDYENWWLASDRMSADPMEWEVNGTTYHADYREAWDDDIRDELQHYCVGLSYDAVTGANHSCNDPNFGNGTRGDIDHIDFSETVDAQNILEIPENPMTATAFNGARLRMRFRRR